MDGPTLSRSARAQRFQLVQIFSSELEQRRGDIFLEMSHLRGAGNRKHRRGPRKKPRERDLHRTRRVPARYALDSLTQPLIAAFRRDDETVRIRMQGLRDQLLRYVRPIRVRRIDEVDTEFDRPAVFVSRVAIVFSFRRWTRKNRVIRSALPWLRALGFRCHEFGTTSCRRTRTGR